MIGNGKGTSKVGERVGPGRLLGRSRSFERSDVQLTYVQTWNKID